MKKNTLFLALGIALALGSVISGCKTETDDNIEIWESSVLRVIVTDDGFYRQYIISNGKEFNRGAWSVSGTTLTITILEVNTALFSSWLVPDNWSSYADLTSLQKAAFGNDTIKVTLTGDSFTTTAYDGGTSISVQTFTKK
jgi:hypothetical protein